MEAGLWKIINERIDRKALFFEQLDFLSQSKLDMFITILWSIWRRQNDRLWKDKETRLVEALCLAHELLHQWKGRLQGERKGGFCSMKYRRILLLFLFGLLQ